MRRKRIVAAFLVAVLAGQFAAPANAQLPPDGMSAAEVTTMFTTYANAGGHWTGGDGTASVALPDGRVVWLFADSFLGTVNPDHSRPTNSPFINNAMVIQDGTTLTSTLHGGTPEAPAALVQPDQDGEIYWVADGVVEGNKLKVIYNRIRTTGTGALDFYQTGVALATFSLPDLTLESLAELPLGPKIGWGGGIFPDGEYTYIYGISSAPGRMKFAHLARVPTGGLSGPWEFWTGSAWSPHVEQVGRLISGVDAGGVQKVGGQYVWVTHESNLVFDPQIVAYTSTSPTGPFTGPIPLFTAPEPQTSGLIIYDVRVHPELARSGKLLVSYNVNSLNPGGTYADVRHGRPRFIEVDWPRPATPGVPAAPGAPTASGHDTAVTVSWPAVSGATSYRVYQKDVTGGQTHFARLPQVATGTSVQAGLLVPGHTYEYKVTAVNAAGEGPFSPVATAVPRSTKPVTEAIHGSRSSAAIAGSYIVELTDATPVHSIADYARALVAETGGTLRGVLTHVLHGFGATLTEAQAIDLASHPDVQAVEQEMRVTLDEGGTQEPAPPHLDRIDQRDLPGDNKYIFPNAGTDVRAYVVDTGVRSGDEEFVNQIAPGHNAIDGSANSEDCTKGHGTMVAGVLGSWTYGVAKDVDIVPVKVGTCDGEGNPVVGFYGVYKGLDWVVADSFDKGPAVVNLSFGMPINEPGAGFVQKAVRKALDNRLTVVTSAGNDNGDACNYSPKRLSRETALISVGAVDGLDRRWSRSNQGPCVDLFAVGEQVMTVGPSSTQVVAWGNGTSMAAPAVAGAAAIVLHEHPEYGPEDVKGALLAAATQGKVTNISTATPNRLLYIGPAPTHAPQNLTATPNEDGTIDLDWDPVPETDVHYLVYSRNLTLGEEELNEWDDPVFDGTSAVFRDGQEGHTYEFRVAAASSGGVGPQSEPAQATVDQAPPEPATNLRATSQSDGTIRLDWTSSAPGLWHYVYMRDLDADPPQEQPARLEWPVSEGNSTTLGWLTHGHEYEMYVTAIGPGGESEPSNLARATATFPLPPGPSNLTGVAGDRSVTLTWQSASEGAWYWVEKRDLTAGETAFTRLELPVSTCCTFVGGDLTNGSTYDFRVVAIGADGGPDSAPSNSVRLTPTARRADPPTGLAAVAGNAQVALTWMAPSTQPDGWYWVETRPAGGTWQRLGLPITTCCSFLSTGLTNGTTYEFRVVTIGADGATDSAPSNVVSARPVAPPTGAPSNLRATAGNARVDLTWTASTQPGAWYWVETRPAGGTWQRLGLPITTCCSFLSTGLTNGTTYEFRVVTIGANGAPDSAPSNVASARPVAPQPAPPSNLRATAGNARVDLTWTASPTAGSWYWIEMRNASKGQSWQRLSTPVTTCCSFSSTGLNNGDTYEYRVRTIGGNGAPDSVPSNVVSARPVAPRPAAPTNLTATPGNGKVTLKWTASTTPGAWYWVYYRNATRGQAWQKISAPITTCCTFVSAFLNNGETYEYRVAAIGGGGAPDSPFSNIASARPMPPVPQAPTNLRASPGDNEAYLSWNASPTPGVVYYMHYRVHYPSGYGPWQRTAFPALTTTMTAGYMTYGWTYEYRIVASNLAGESPPSNVVSVLIVPYNQRRKCASVTSNWALGGKDAVQLYDVTTSLCATRSNFTFKLEASWSSRVKVRDAAWFWRLVDCYSGKEIARYGIGYPAPGTDLRSQTEVVYWGLKPGNLYRFTLEGWGKLTGHIGEETRFSPYPDGHVGIIPHSAATSCF